MIGYRAEVDGLRAIAVISVVMFHAGVSYFSGGFVGVDIFFVISGYLITSIIFLEIRDGKFNLQNFYERRIRRILPALLFITIVCTPVAYLLLMPRDLKDFSQSVLALSFFASNFLFMQEADYFDTSAELKPLLHTWSLAVEEQYYLIFPVIMILVSRWRDFSIGILIALVALVSLLLAEYTTRSSPSAAFYMLPMRMWELMVGGIAALMACKKLGDFYQPVARQLFSIVGLVLISISIVSYSQETRFPGFSAILPVFGAFLVIVFASNGTFVARVLSSTPLVAIGLMSYSVYLWHQPILSFSRHFFVVELGGFLVFCLVCLSLFLGYITWLFIEKPFREKERFSRGFVYFFSLSGFLVLLIFGFSGQFSNGTFGRDYDPELRNVISADLQRGDNSNCWQNVSSNIFSESSCDIGLIGAQYEFAVFGDSHAGRFIVGLDEEFEELGVSGKNFTQSSCTPLISGGRLDDSIDTRTCKVLRERFFESQDSSGSAKTIILIARWAIRVEESYFDNTLGGVEIGSYVPWKSPGQDELGQFQALSKSLNETITAILSSGKKVVLVYPIPEMGWDVPRYLNITYRRNGKISESDGAIPQSVYNERNKRTIALLDSVGEHDSLLRFYPDKVLCDTLVPEMCIAHIAGVPIYSDDDHLTKFGAALLIDGILAGIR